MTLVVAASLLVATTLTACAPTSEQPDSLTDPGASTTDTFKELGGVLDEYEAATEVYLLPSGYTYPEAPFNDATGSYQEGYGTSAAVTIWNCAWGETYLAAQGVDPVAAEAALVQFAAITDTDTYVRFYDPVSAHPLFEQAIEDAQLGDPTTIQSIVAGTCAQ